MKKLFLIPLMTLCTCVMAWAGIYNQFPDPDGVLGNGPHKASIRKAVMDEEPATNEAKIGDVEYESLQAALEAATNGDVVELLADVNTGSWLAAEVDNKSLTIKGNGFEIQGCLILANETDSSMEITFDGVSINSSAWVMYAIGDIDIVLKAGSSNSLASSKNYGIYGYGNSGDVNISGQGTLTSSISYMFYQCGNVQIEAPNATFSTTSSSFAQQSTNIVLEAGSYGINPSPYVDFTSYIVTKPSSLYIVSAPAADVVAYNGNKLTTYTSLADAVTAASAADVIYLYKNDASAVAVAKNITIATNGHSTNLSAGEGFSRADMGQNVVFTDNAIAAFLMADGTASLTVSEDANIASAGAIHVNGTKTLTINEGVTVTYKRQGSDGNIVVDNGAKLTVLGSGTFAPQMHSETNTVNGFTVETSTTASNQVGNRAIDVAVGGELVVGVKDDANNCPHFITSSIARGSAVSVEGKATFNNANIQAACASIWNYGLVIINSGEYVSVATSQNGINSGWYSYNLRNDAGSNLVINDGHFVGTQGSVAVYAGATADINGGYFETVHGYNYKTGAANEKDHHYALYVATEAIVNVYNGYFKVATPSAGGGKVILSGNDDAYNTYGVINIYGGYFQRKADVQNKKNGESSYPASVPTTSQWYSSFGSLAPLPAGYEYYDTDDATYPYGVRAVAGKEADAIDPAKQAAQEADPTYTIPWQQATTWAAAEVPVENTIVTIPVDATVTVSKAEEVKEAVADQVYVAQGATLKVEEGTTLTVGEGGVNIGNGGQLVVEAGATVKIGAAGIITTEEEALVIESSEEIQGTLIYDPAVSENTQPKASVRLYTKCYQKHASPYEYQWQRFAIPLIEMVSKPANDYVDQPLFAGQSEFKSYLFGWGGENWVQPTGGWLGLEPNKGYQVANNTIAGGITYTFHGNLIANNNGNYDFEANGFSFFGNSYTAPINVRSLLNEFNNQGGFEHTIHVYDMEGDGFIAMTQNTFDDYDEGMLDDDDIKQEIASMQAFIIKGAAGEAANMSYETSIWNPLVNPSNNAPQRRSVSSNRDIVVLNVAANGKKDRITLRQSDEFSAEFDNSADASKYMNEGTFNIYANTEIGELAEVSTDELNNTILGFQSAEATEYTLTCSGQKGESFILRDLLTGAEVNLEKGATYTFAQQPNTTNEARFQIVEGRMAPTAVENVQNVKKAEGIYTVLGKYLGAADQLDKLPAGMYIVNGVKIVK